ncbi:MAG: NAD(P)/FAD-dependent oxidoreductase, partial [Acidimicrobiaceae bacterium]|nr:NAD(P)/FAD-dependent oxidoreductase [Acidimicrobiaceae bacterium]
MFAAPDTPMTAEEEQLYTEAVHVANIPTLLMVLVQLTGEMHWLEEPYRPRRQAGLGDNDTGGLRPEHQQEVREAALEAMTAWRQGRPVALADPDPELLVKMLHVAMDEDIPDLYGPFTKSQLGEQPVGTAPIDVPEGFNAIVIGAGVSGICAAVHLQAAGIPFEILERNRDIGGVWLENTYPGAGVDTPNHLYSFSFVQYDWPEFFALRDDLWGYLGHVVDQFDLRPTIALNISVETAEYREVEQDWKVTTRSADGTVEVRTANVVISGAGIFNPPVSPKIDGIETFAGPSFHTAQWRDDVSLEGKRVAIVGNGASCMQIAPLIQDQVESLTI